MPVNTLRRATIAPLAAACLLLTACGDGGDDGGEPSAPPAAKGTATDLSSVCPEKVVIQTSWLPQATSFGPLYHLLGDDRDVDAAKKRVTAPLVTSEGESTGVQLELRAGGPAVGFTPTTSQMYQDQDITLGVVGGFDEIVQLSAKQPTLAVLAMLEKDPTTIYWDPETYPEFETIEDVGKTDTTVLYFGGDTYMEYLIGSDKLKKSQVDGSFDGSPARFVAEGGKVATAGYAAEDPYAYEHEVKPWGKPIKGQMVYDAGYPIYGPSMVIRPEEKAELAPCLKKLVPVIQQAQVDYIRHPQQTIDTIVEIADAYKGGDVVSTGIAEYGIGEMKKLGLAADDAAGKDTTVGNFELDRVQDVIDIDKPIFAEQGKPIKDGLTPEDVVTNEFVDPKIGHSSGS